MKTPRLLILLALFAIVFGASCKQEAKNDSDVEYRTNESAPGKHLMPQDGNIAESEKQAPAKGEKLNWTAANRAKFGDAKPEMKSRDGLMLRDAGDFYLKNYGASSKNTKSEDSDDKIDPGWRENRYPSPDEDMPERVEQYYVNKFIATTENALSTFAIDVDTASYTSMRNEINNGRLPRPSSVRVEEYINYFDYKYPAPSSGLFAVYSQLAANPFNYGETTLLRVALRAKDISKEARRTAHLTFMIDVSGSMQASNKLPLVKKTLKILLENLREDDTIAICTYSTEAEKILEATRVKNKDVILAAIEPLYADGSTNGQAGMHKAYELANNAFVEGDINRIIMCTDGDFNVGVTDGKNLAEQVNHFARKGITITAIGYGDVSYDDITCEDIADAGNGNSFYIDSVDEINRIFGKNLVSTLDVVAADVKIQLEFNPNIVSEYRLVGYENRALTAEQFRDDIVDAGEVGPGHAVTAIYELKLAANVSVDKEIPKDLKDLAAMFRIRYKENITDEKASEVNFGIENKVLKFDKADSSLKFAVGVMGFADIMRASPFAKGWRINTAIDCCNTGKTASGTQADGFIELMRKAISMRDK